jgi:hypothetical protein
MELRSTDRAQVDPSSAEWSQYYADADRRHRRARHRRRRGPSRKQRERIATLMMIGSVMFIGALTAVFYSVLTR